MSFRVQSVLKLGLIVAAPILLVSAFSTTTPFNFNNPASSTRLPSKDLTSNLKQVPSFTPFSSFRKATESEDSVQTPDGNGGGKTMLSLSQAFQLVGKTTSAVVAGTFYIVMAYQRDALMVSFFIGAISNGILSKVLKKVLNISRPEELDLQELELKPSDNGMPSSHAMSLGFIGTFTALSLPWTTVPIILYSIISLVYRIQTKLHTVDQVLVGATVGTLNGWLWRILCTSDNSFGFTITDWVSSSFLNEQGLLPYWALAVPALIGAMVVGSVERRIARFLEQRKKGE